MLVVDTVTRPNFTFKYPSQLEVTSFHFLTRRGIGWQVNDFEYDLTRKLEQLARWLRSAESESDIPEVRVRLGLDDRDSKYRVLPVN